MTTRQRRGAAREGEDMDINHVKAAFRQRQMPKGGAQGTKKGKRGYNRKTAKAETRKARTDES